LIGCSAEFEQAANQGGIVQRGKKTIDWILYFVGQPLLDKTFLTRIVRSFEVPINFGGGLSRR
jgi:hypothetical protein